MLHRCAQDEYHSLTNQIAFHYSVFSIFFSIHVWSRHNRSPRDISYGFWLSQSVKGQKYREHTPPSRETVSFPIEYSSILLSHPMNRIDLDSSSQLYDPGPPMNDGLCSGIFLLHFQLSLFARYNCDTAKVMNQVRNSKDGFKLI